MEPCYEFLSCIVVMYLPSIWAQAAAKFLQCQHKTQPIFFASLCALFVSYPAHWFLVPIYGVRGLVLAQTLSFLVQFGCLLYVMYTQCQESFLGAFFDWQWHKEEE